MIGLATVEPERGRLGHSDCVCWRSGGTSLDGHETRVSTTGHTRAGRSKRRLGRGVVLRAENEINSVADGRRYLIGGEDEGCTTDLYLVGDASNGGGKGSECDRSESETHVEFLSLVYLERRDKIKTGKAGLDEGKARTSW